MVLAVAKALRRVTEGKASALAEAAEWKRKYELARAQNLQLEQKGYFSLCSILCLTSYLWSYPTWNSAHSANASLFIYYVFCDESLNVLVT